MSTGTGVPSLTDYAVARGQHHTSTPWFETLPQEIQDEVVTAWKSGLRATVIVEWLYAKGFEDVTKSKVNNYLAAKYGTSK